MFARLDCYFKGLWRTLRYRANISGHDFVEIESNNKHEQILQCEHCGAVSRAWSR